MHEPIVTKELFDKVQEINRAANKRFKDNLHVNEGEENIYRDYVVCGDCGKKMRRTHVYVKCDNGKTNRHDYFTCGGYIDSHRQNCTSHHCSVELVEKTVLAQIKQYTKMMADAENLFGRLKKSEKYQNINSMHEKEMAELQRKQTRIERLKESLYISLQEGLINEAEYLEMRSGYVDELEILQGQIVKCQERNTKIQNSFSKVEDVFRLIKSISRKKKLDIQMLKAFIHRIKIYEDKRIEIVFAFQDRFAMLADLERMVDENEK